MKVEKILFAYHTDVENILYAMQRLIAGEDVWDNGKIPFIDYVPRGYMYDPDSGYREYYFKENTVMVNEFYMLAGIPVNDKNEHYGWTDISSARIKYDRGSYYIDFPEAEEV